jgi:O-methyltransferase
MFAHLAKRILERCGLRVISANSHLFSEIPENVEPEFLPLYERSRHHTLSSFESMYAIYRGVGHVVKHGIAGDLAECGVWAGGGVMMAALALQHFGDTSRRLWLYDTFEGMDAPTEKDVDFKNRSAADHLKTWKASDFSQMARVGLDAVRRAMASTGYPQDKLKFVKGRVEETIPAQTPDRISLLRLDTDWYESTRHELEHLFPRLSRGAVIIIDDYGFWKGARQATDEYFAREKIPILLTRIDRIGAVVGVKP